MSSVCTTLDLSSEIADSNYKPLSEVHVIVERRYKTLIGNYFVGP